MSTRRLLATLPAVALLGLLAALGGCESALVEGRQVGNLCPEVAGEDPDGKVIRLSDYRGKVVLVNFWGTWCGPCRMLLPHERQMVQGRYKGRPFVLLGIAQDSPETLKEFLATEPLPWPNIADGIGRLGREWGVDAVPSAVLVDHRGVIRKRWLGGLNPGEVWEAVEKAVHNAEQGP